jgi:ABC-type phosphate transport system substrate-binding protein
MKLTMLLAVGAALLLGACASLDKTQETVTEIPPQDTAARAQVPAQGSSKIPGDQNF